MTSSTLPFELRSGNKFAFLLISNVHTNLPPQMPTQLSNGAWVLNKYPTSPDLHWEKMIGEIRFREITEANLIPARVTEGQSYVLTQADKQWRTSVGLYTARELWTAATPCGSLEYPRVVPTSESRRQSGSCLLELRRQIDHF